MLLLVSSSCSSRREELILDHSDLELRAEVEKLFQTLEIPLPTATQLFEDASPLASESPSFSLSLLECDIDFSFS